jgi:hypothetical protein
MQPAALPERAAARRLRAIKLAHTAIWAFFASCILGIPLAARADRFDVALVLAVIVLVEVGVLLANGMVCPLTPLAARHTVDRAPNFDIYLPRWLAANNKAIFGALFAAGVVYALLRWIATRG